jgi:N-acyl-D-aspartate/D-glutamate deacylase
MPYDLLIRNGRIVDGSGTPSFHGDVGIRNGKIAEVGKLRGTAKRTIDVQGLAVAPGFIDTHCHYDAQVTWDPLCTFSCYHGATTVIISNCSLALAPVRKGKGQRLEEFLSYVEAIPMETLKTVDVRWESIGDYMAVLDQRLGVNVGNLIGHTAVRHYVMGEESQGRAATAAEIESMRDVVRKGIEAGALGLSINRSKGHFDPQGVNIPAVWANEEEIFALCDVLAELGTGVIQSGAGRPAELKTGLMTRIAERTGRQVVYNNLNVTAKKPHEWKELMAAVDETVKKGIRANPMCNPNSASYQFTMRNCQVFRNVPSWQPIQIAPDDEKLKAYADASVRKLLHEEAIEWKKDIEGNLARTWYDTIKIEKTILDKNKSFEGKTLRQLAEAQGKGIIDAYLDLVVEEHLDTVFLMAASGTNKEAMTKILTYPHAYIGLSDAGAHVQFRGGTGFSTRLLGYWVRQEGIMSLEQAVRRLTFDSASVFGIYDRGMLRPGLAADITIFDPDTINTLPPDVVHDLPGGSWRLRELAVGIHYSVVNGEVLIEQGKHSGALPGRVVRNALYHERAHA